MHTWQERDYLSLHMLCHLCIHTPWPVDRGLLGPRDRGRHFQKHSAHSQLIILELGSSKGPCLGITLESHNVWEAKMAQKYPSPNLQRPQMKYHSLPEKHRFYPELLHVPHMRKLASPPVCMYICVCTQITCACLHTGIAHTGVCTHWCTSRNTLPWQQALARATPLVTGAPGQPR